MKKDFKNKALIFYLEGHIDSSNADRFSQELRDECSLYSDIDIVLDAENLNYISSAGLRAILKLKKDTKMPVRVINVSHEVYDIFDVTGFTDIFEVERKLRRISIQGCKRLSSALNGEIFRLSHDEMIKVFGAGIPLSEVKKERQYAQTALAFGVPTLIPYDVVKCEHGYGIVYEKAEATSLANLILRDPKNVQIYANMLAKTLRELHSTDVPQDKLPDIKDKYRKWIEEIDDPSDSKAVIFSNILSSIPDSNRYVHGDINLNNCMVKDGELLLLDMSGSGHGNSLFDLQALFASLVAMEREKAGYCLKTFGLSSNTCRSFWDIFFASYMQDRKQEIASMNQLLLKYSVLKESILTRLEEKNRFKPGE